MTSPFASQKAFGFITVASTLLFAATTQAAQTLTAQLCEQFQAVSSTNELYIFNNNAWGEDKSGAECTDVFNGGDSFQTVWSWSDNGNNTHSFPNVQLSEPDILPLILSNLSAMNLQASWTMAPVDGSTRANVVYDMFFDPDPTTAGNASAAKFEMMIWIGAFDDPFPLGASVNPFGVVNKTLPSITVGTTDFTLFSGNNSDGQTVHSWVPTTTNVSDFEGDVTPLITYLTKNKLVPSTDYLGLLQFGSETWHSTGNVTFAVSSFNLNVTSTDTAADAKASQAASAATSTSGSSGSSSTSSSSSSSTAKSSSSIVSLPFWFWEIAAAGCLFAML